MCQKTQVLNRRLAFEFMQFIISQIFKNILLLFGSQILLLAYWTQLEGVQNHILSVDRLLNLCFKKEMRDTNLL